MARKTVMNFGSCPVIVPQIVEVEWIDCGFRAEGGRTPPGSLRGQAMKTAELRRARRQLVPLPPHLPVATLKLPQDIGVRQSEIRSLESGRIVRPFVADHEARGLPDGLELAVGLDFADQHRLGDVVVRHHASNSRR